MTKTMLHVSYIEATINNQSEFEFGEFKSYDSLGNVSKKD